jgi:integrase
MPTGTISPPAFKFTASAVKAAIESLPPRGEATLKDTEVTGLVLRRRTVSWSYYLRRKVEGSVVTRHLADYSPGASIPEIRKLATATVADITTGRDLEDQKRGTANRAKDALFDMGWDELLQKHGETARVRASTLDTMGYSLKGMRPFLPKKVGELTDTKGREVFKKVMGSGIAESTAMGRMKHLQTLVETWRFLHPLEKRPAFNAVTEAMRVGARKTLWKDAPARTNRLRDMQEIADFITACRDLGRKAGPVRGVAFHAIEMLALSGCRAGEIFGLEWADIEGDWITIPEDRYKTGKDFRKVITPRMREILQIRREVASTRYVFESIKTDSPRPIDDVRKSMDAIARLVTKRLKEAIGDNPSEADQKRLDRPKMTPHALRRTYSSAATEAGYSKDIVQLLIGHAIKGVTGDYIGRMEKQLPEMAAKVESLMLAEVE